MEMLYLFVSLAASIAGAICGIGGGIIIKPSLDMLGVASAATVSFLSTCTVISMSLYSIVKSVHAREKLVDFRACTPLALGAAVGGVLGKILFDLIAKGAANPLLAGKVQAGCMALATAATLIYTLRRSHITPRAVHSFAGRAGIGLCLGMVSSFLGVGGGPMNLVVLFHFFRMDTKVAAQNSLYIILVSQLANFLTTVVARNIPPFAPLSLALMILGGILGGILGRKISKSIRSATVEKLLLCMMGLIVTISVYNAIRY